MTSFFHRKHFRKLFRNFGKICRQLPAAFLNDFALSENKKEILRPVRDDVVLIYRKIMAEKINCDDLRPLFCAFNSMSSGKIQIIIDILLDLGLIEPVRTDMINYYAPVAVKEKKDLMSSKILLALQ